MPTTPISKDYAHTTCCISVQGETLTPDAISELTSPINCTIQLDVSGSPHTFEGDGETLHDLVATIERYLKYLLSSQPQGTFSGSVAIRPLDAVRHRITLKQGTGIGQADLTTTQLYDLAESLGEIGESIPHLARLKTPAKTVSWYRRPAASVAALALVGVGVLAASLVLTRPATEELGETEYRVDDRVNQLAESPIDPTEGGDPGVLGSTEPPLQPSLSMPSTESVPHSSSESGVPSDSVLEDDANLEAVFPSEVGDGEIDADVEIANAEAADSSARSATSSVAVPDGQAQQTQQLTESLGESWQAPESLTESLEYDLTIAEDGTILTAAPADNRAAEFQPQTPFANLPATSEREGTQLRVTLEPDSSVTVTMPPQG